MSSAHGTESRQDVINPAPSGEAPLAHLQGFRALRHRVEVMDSHSPAQGIRNRPRGRSG